MFADPLTLPATLANTATNANLYTGAGYVSLDYVCIGRGPLSSNYRYTISSTHWVDLLISRQEGKRKRYTVRFTETELVTDPINSELNQLKTSTVYLVADVGVLGTGSNWVNMANGLARFLQTPYNLESLLAAVLRGNT